MSTDAAAADIPVPQVEATADPVVETTTDAPAGDAKTTKATKAKAAKTPKAPKVKKPSAPRKPKAAPAHPTYAEMVTEAIAALKERGGGGTVAIAKYIEDKHKAHLPANFRKFMLTQIKKLSNVAGIIAVRNTKKQRLYSSVYMTGASVTTAEIWNIQCDFGWTYFGDSASAATA
ncbi:Histone H1 [Triticum urartu]|uniref:Histone H1 n=1 Tax=Triticum urartu TaxID=4572 RepID=M7YRS8_TRIUA|nr:Histone H1 [Triticum urartu]